jgi:hypothetical protein
MTHVRLVALISALLVLSVGPVSSRTREIKPWHVLKPLTCCTDDNTGTATFVESYETRQQCMAAALGLARNLSPPGCSSAACGVEVWRINVDESGVNGSMTQVPPKLAAAPVNRFDSVTFKLATSMSEAQVELRLGPPVRVEMGSQSLKIWHYQDASSPDQLDIYFFRPNDSAAWLVNSWRVH